MAANKSRNALRSPTLLGGVVHNEPATQECHRGRVAEDWTGILAEADHRSGQVGSRFQPGVDHIRPKGITCSTMGVVVANTSVLPRPRTGLDGAPDIRQRRWLPRWMTPGNTMRSRDAELEAHAGRNLARREPVAELDVIRLHLGHHDMRLLATGLPGFGE